MLVNWQARHGIAKLIGPLPFTIHTSSIKDDITHDHNTEHSLTTYSPTTYSLTTSKRLTH